MMPSDQLHAAPERKHRASRQDDVRRSRYNEVSALQRLLVDSILGGTAFSHKHIQSGSGDNDETVGNMDLSGPLCGLQPFGSFFGDSADRLVGRTM
jgi:hypothetical protein